jgi:hypothetical protein
MIAQSPRTAPKAVNTCTPYAAIRFTRRTSYV